MSFSPSSFRYCEKGKQNGGEGEKRNGSKTKTQDSRRRTQTVRTEEIKPVSPADQEQVLGKAAANGKTKKEQENTEGRTSIPQSSRSNTTNRTSSCTNEEEGQPQQHHQPHQLIISFGLCFHFLAYKTCRNREEEVQKTRRKREDQRL